MSVSKSGTVKYFYGTLYSTDQLLEDWADYRGNGANDQIVAGDGPNYIDGGGGNDTITGNRGSDLILGGTGNDRLTGGMEVDSFTFHTALNARKNVDTITDFQHGQDRIALSLKIFKAADYTVKTDAFGNPEGDGQFEAFGLLKHGGFRMGPAAADEDDRIIYTKATGALYYDPDGTGPAEQIKFAQLKAKAALTWKDIIVY
jgi:Ca2+-binding RTX toxin-like protein